MRKPFIIIGLILLVGCSTYEKKPFNFISKTKINFLMSEDSLVNCNRRVDNMTFHDNYPILFGSGYKAFDFLTNSYFKLDLNSYYLFNSNKPYADIVILDFCYRKLWCIEIYTRRKNNIDSLIMLTEQFFNKKFVSSLGGYPHYDSIKYGKDLNHYENIWTSEEGVLKKNKISAYFLKDLVYNEVRIYIINSKIKTPHWHKTKKRWWINLMFWRWIN